MRRIKTKNNIFIFFILIISVSTYGCININTNSNSSNLNSNYVRLSATLFNGKIFYNNYHSLEDAIKELNSLNIQNGNIQNGDVYLNGVLNVTSEIIPAEDNVTIRGNGKDSVINFGSNNGQLFFDNRKAITLKDFSIKSDNGVAKDRILFNYSDSIKICNLKVYGGGQIWYHFAILFDTGNSNITLCNIDTRNTEDSPIRFFNRNGLNQNRDILIYDYHNYGDIHAVTAEGYEGGDGVDLYGAQNVTIYNYIAENLDGNGIGIYADAKNITGDNIFLKNIGGENHTGHCIGISRWNDKDPSNIHLNNITIQDCWGHGIHLFTQPHISSNNYKFGKISNVTITNVSIKRVWWSGVALEGGGISEISISNFNIDETNLDDKKSPVIFLNATYFANTTIRDGRLTLPYIMPRQRKGVSFQNVSTI